MLFRLGRQKTFAFMVRLGRNFVGQGRAETLSCLLFRLGQVETQCSLC